MKATSLYNYRQSDYETDESFAKRVYDTAKRYRSHLFLDPQDSYHVLTLLAKYYKESVSDILSVIRDIQWRDASRKYSIDWVRHDGLYYLMIEKRKIFDF